jgi:hypothetical protein
MLEKPMFTLEFLQAVSDWQQGGSAKVKAKRGAKLKAEAAKVSEKYRSPSLCLFRQISLAKTPLYKLMDTLRLPETVSAWTKDTSVAKEFKGGVPDIEWQGVIFAIPPKTGSVILDLDALYRDPKFQKAIEDQKHKITGYDKGAGRYLGIQREVVLEIESVNLDDVYALGGYSSDIDTLGRLWLGRMPSDDEKEFMVRTLSDAGQAAGPYWLEAPGKDRVLAKIQDSDMPRLRKIKQLQDAAASE